MNLTGLHRGTVYICTNILLEITLSSTIDINTINNQQLAINMKIPAVSNNVLSFLDVMKCEFTEQSNKWGYLARMYSELCL